MNPSRIYITAFVILILALIPCAHCHAAPAILLSLDHPRYGADSITRDAVSGLDWLDWSASINHSVADVSTQFGPGDEFAGFRYATEAEVIQLIYRAGFANLWGWPGQAIDYEAARNLADLLGVTEQIRNSTSDVYLARGYMGPADQIIPDYNLQMVVSYDKRRLTGLAGANGGFQGPVGFGDAPDPTVGHVLVRAVPEPCVVMLCVIGGSCLGLLRRHS